jgi:hypothetical protein
VCRRGRVQSHRCLTGRLTAALPILASAVAPLTPSFTFVVAPLAPLLGGDHPKQLGLHDAHLTESGLDLGGTRPRR